MADNKINNLGLEGENLENYHNYLEIKEKLDKEGKKEFFFKEGKVLIAGENFIYKLKNGEKIVFHENSKIFFFSNKLLNIIKKPYFIHDEKSLNKALEKTQIKNGEFIHDEDKPEIKKNSESDKSIRFKYSINSLDIKEILKASYNCIEESKPIPINKIFTQKNLETKFNFHKISDLDFSFKYLDEDYINNNLEYIKKQNEWYIKLEEIYSNKEKSHCFIFGPKGIGKTTLLLKYLKFEEIPRLYFSLKIMSKPRFNNRKWKKISLYETIYTFKDENEMQTFSEKILKDILDDTPNLMEFIFSYIKLIFNFYSDIKSRKKIFVVIDDYNQELYDKDNIIEQIINYVKSNKGRLFLFILGEGKYINKKLYQYLTNENKDFLGTYWDLLIENESTNKTPILKLPKYFYKYKDLTEKTNLEEIVEQSIINEFREINLNCFIELSKYINTSINIAEIKDEFLILPFQYLTIEKKINIYDEKLITLKFNLEIYQKVFDDSIKELLMADNLKTKVNLLNDENKGKDGIELEDLIVEQLWNNTFDFIQFPDNNKLNVKGIDSLKNNENDTRNNIILSEPIIIRQITFKGRYYDLLLIINQNGKKCAIFVQIGFNTIREYINSCFQNLTKYYNQYEKGIKKLINYENEESELELGLLLIFDFEHLKALRENNKKSEALEFCIKNDIDFLIYKDFQLFKNIDDTNPIKSIEVADKILSNEYEEKEKNINLKRIKDKFEEICHTISLKKISIPILPLSEKEKTMILNFIKNEYKIEFSELDFAFNIYENFKGFSNFGILDTNNFSRINIFINENSKYFSYNNILYKIDKEKIIRTNNIKRISKIENYNWDLYFLKRKRKLKNIIFK